MKTIFIKKANMHVDLDESKLRADYIETATWRGFKEALQDSVAAAKSEDEAKGMLEKTVARFLDGTYASHERGASDPIGKEMDRIANLRFKALRKESRETIKGDEYDSALDEYMTAHADELRKAAESIIKLRAGAPDA